MFKPRSVYTGLDGIQAAPVIARLVSGAAKKTIVVVPGQDIAASFAKNLSFFIGDRAEVFSLPDDDPPLLKAEARSREAEAARLSVMSALCTERDVVVVCPVSMAIRDICKPETFLDSRIELSTGGEINRDDLIRKVVELGYRRAPYTENAGEFSARGDILERICAYSR